MLMQDIVESPKQQLLEGIPHPEDRVWSGGIAGAREAVNGLSLMTTGKEQTSIKWDGYPALVFGRNVDGELMLTDKHMFGKKDGSGRVMSPADFLKYDQARGVDRSDLYGKINLLWPALETIIPAKFRGFYFGDLLYTGRLEPQGGFYTFKPNTVTYKVRADSAQGKCIAASVAGIAVHSFIPGIGEPDQPLNGTGGLPTNGNPIWFTTGEMPAPKLNMDKKAVAATNSIIDEYDTAVTQFMGDLQAQKAKSVTGLASKYITAKIGEGNFDHMLGGFYTYLKSHLTPAAQARLLGDGKGFLYTQGRPGLEGMFAIWVAIYNLKLNMKKQVDAQQAQSDVQAFIGNQAGHEGYVVGAGADKFKLIDRLNFSRANFAKNGT